MRVTTDDPHVYEDFELLDADRSVVVTTTDGVPLAVREVGAQDAPLTVVFRARLLSAYGGLPFSASPAYRAMGLCGADGLLRPTWTRAIR